MFSTVEHCVASLLAYVEVVFDQTIATFFVARMAPTQSHLRTLSVTVKLLSTCYFFAETFATTNFLHHLKLEET